MTITEKYLDYIFPILYIEISQSQPVTAVSRLAVSHHWSASGSWHRTWWNILLLQRSLCQTLWTLNWLLFCWLQELLRKQWT